MVKLNDRKIRWICNQVTKYGMEIKRAAAIQKVTCRRVQQIVKTYRETGQYPKLNMNRRPKTELTAEQKEIIKTAYNEVFLGARLLRHHIRVNYGMNIPQNKIHSYLLELRYAKPNPKKQKQRKRCRYERKHSFSLVHTDWLDAKDGEGTQVIAYLDDASRYLLSLGEFKEATTANSIIMLDEAIKETKKYSARIYAVNTDRGPQFFANKIGRKGKGVSKYEKCLRSKGIKHVVSRKQNPQTNGKIERWFQEYLRHRKRFEVVDAFRHWYNHRLHGELDLDRGESPSLAVQRKLRSESILGEFVRLMGL
jgi:putative transposase